MSKIDKKFVAQYQAAYTDGKISNAEAKKLAKSADGNKAREAYLREHLRQDAFEGSEGRQAVEKAVGNDGRRASGYVGQTIGVASTGRDIKVTRELGDPAGYVSLGDARNVAEATGKDAAVLLGPDGRWHPVAVDAAGGSLATAKRSSADVQAINTQFMPAPVAGKVEPTSRNSFAVELNPPAASAKGAAQAIFGKDQAPEGFTLKKYGKGWEVVIATDPKREWPNDIPWEKYQAEVKPGVQQLHYAGADAKFNVPRPGAAPVQVADPYGAQKEKAKQVTVEGWSSGTTLAETIAGMKSIDVTTYDVRLPKAMTKQEAAQFFFEQNGTPKAHGMEPLPKGSKGPWAQWRVMVPSGPYTPANLDKDAKGMDIHMRLHLAQTSTKEQRQLPAWIGEKTAAAINGKQLPPKGLEVTSPRPGISVWKEGNGVYWFDQKSGQVQGFEKKPGTGVGAKMWNNWNESRIMNEGMSPADAAVQTVKDMDSTNKQMLMAFAQAMAANRAPGHGVAEIVVKGVDVTGKLGLHEQPTGTDDIWQKMREIEAKRAGQ